MQPPSIVAVYSQRWPADFRAIARFLRPALPVGVRVEHVGSTSVPGLAAKSIIDLDLVVASEPQVWETVTAVAELGYEHRGDGGIPGRQAFHSLGGLPYHHLYVVVDGSEAHRDHIDLRDYLRTHAEEAHRYAAEKRRLEHLLATDPQAYVIGKGPFISDLLRRARA